MSSFSVLAMTYDPKSEPLDTSIDLGRLPPNYEVHAGQESYFGEEHPLSESIGYAVIVGFGAFFSIITTLIVYIGRRYGSDNEMTSEYFNTAGRRIKTGLTASVIVSKWTWAATLLQSSNVAYKYGVSGPFWYASGATIQVLLFGILAVKLKKIAPSAHTVTEIVRARWGTSAHITFLFFAFATNIIVTSMLLLGGAATVEALTGMDYRLASFMIPWGIILYTCSGGLKATFLASYLHTVIIYLVLLVMIFLVYIKMYSSDQIYDLLQNTISKTPQQCEVIYSSNQNFTFYEAGKYPCGPIAGNHEGSYLTMLSADGLMFGMINIVGNFGTVFVDQSYWQSAIAAKPNSAARGYILGGLCWFAIPFSLATSLGLASTALMLPITADEASAGLVPPAVATELLGQGGSFLILTMLFMAIVSTGAAESIAVSSLVAYDIYRPYMNPTASGEQILFVSRVVIVVFGLTMGVFSIILHEIGVDLGWVYLFMGIIIGSAVVPLWNLMTWEKASGAGAVFAAWAGLVFGLIGWVFVALYLDDTLSIESLGTNEAMLTGNLTSICSSGIIHYVYSVILDTTDYDFSKLDGNITLVEADWRGLDEKDRDMKKLVCAETWITWRGWALTLLLVVIWPAMTVPAGVFTKSYFAFWVFIAVVWGFGAAIAVVVLPINESWSDIFKIVSNLSEKLFRHSLIDHEDHTCDGTHSIQTNTSHMHSSVPRLQGLSYDDKEESKSSNEDKV